MTRNGHAGDNFAALTSLRQAMDLVRTGGRGETGRRVPFLVWCLALAGLSLLLPWDLSFDPWGWVGMGRAIADPAVHFSTDAYPSWKPLPVMLASVFSLAGAAAPVLWLLFARAAALAALVLAYRLAARLGGRVAGVFAVAGLLLVSDWLRFFANGTSEPLLVALVLGAIELHLSGRRGWALGLGFGAALLRPEVWPFLAVYGVVFARGSRARALIAAAVLAAVPLLWFVPDWIGSGNAFFGSTIAQRSSEARFAHDQPNPPLWALDGQLTLVIAPLALAAVFALVQAARARRKLPLVLAVGALVWIAIVVVMTALGYAGLPRFGLPAAALVCVLAGTGVSELVKRSGPRWSVPATVCMALLCVPFAVPRAQEMADAARDAASRATLDDQLLAGVDRLGGAERVLDCGRPATESPFFTMLAWRLGLPVTTIDQLHHPAIVFRTRDRTLTGIGTVRALAPRGPDRMIGRIGGWDILVNARDRECTSLRLRSD